VGETAPRTQIQVAAFVQLTGPDLPDRQVRVLLGVDQREHRVAFRARRLRRHTCSAEFGECRVQRVVGDAGVSVLSEIASKSP
jgi:hypothetical protein